MSEPATVCYDCTQLTSGQCWRHGSSSYAASTHSIHHLRLTFVNGRVEKINVQYEDGTSQELR